MNLNHIPRPAYEKETTMNLTPAAHWSEAANVAALEALEAARVQAPAFDFAPTLHDARMAAQDAITGGRDAFDAALETFAAAFDAA